MSYRSIMTYVDDADASVSRLAHAVLLARQFDAHLTVLGMGYEPNLPAYAYGAPAAGVIADISAEAQATAKSHAKTANDTIAQEGILADVMPLTCAYGDFDRTLANHAQFSDLVVLSPPLGEGVPPSSREAFDGALFDTDAATLVCPPQADPTPPETVMIAWNGEREALRAVRRAMPFLSRAKRVEIVSIDPPEYGPEPGERLAIMLSRHGITAEIMVLPGASRPISAMLSQRATELGAGLVVMGGYGHSRLRQYVIGGVTRDVLSAFPMPVLMAH